MDMAKGAGPAAPTGIPAGAPGEQAAIEAIRRIDPALALRVREVAKEVMAMQHRPPTIDAEEVATEEVG